MSIGEIRNKSKGEKTSKEQKILTGLDCEVEIQASFADQIDLQVNVVLGDVFLRLSQLQIIHLMLHTMSRRETTYEQTRKFRAMTPVQKFQFLVKKVLRKLNFKKRAVENMLKKYRQYKYQTYIDTYSRKLLQVGLTRQELDMLEKIEEASSLAEIMYLRNLVLERQMISNLYMAPRIHTGEQFFDRSSLGLLEIRLVDYNALLV